MIILGEQVKNLKSRSQADPGKQLALPPGVFKLLQGSFTVWKAPAGNFQKSPSVIWPWLLFSEVSMCSWCVFVHVWKSDFCFKLVSYCNTMEGKLSPQVAVCLQENLYLPVDPWGEGIILFSLINFCLLFLSLARSLFPAQGHSYSCFPGPMSHAWFLVVLQRSQCRCLCTFLKSFGSISMPARDEGHQTVRLSLPQLLSFLLSSVAWDGLLSPRGSLMLHVFLISWHSRAGFSLTVMRRRLWCHSLWFWSIRVLGPDSVLINGFSIWKYVLPFLWCFPNGMSGKGQEFFFFFLFPICSSWGLLGALVLCCGSLLMQVSWGL